MLILYVAVKDNGPIDEEEEEKWDADILPVTDTSSKAVPYVTQSSAERSSICSNYFIMHESRFDVIKKDTRLYR